MTIENTKQELSGLYDEGDISVLVADAPAAYLPSNPDTFMISDEKSANWLVRKILASRQYANHVKEWADQECRRAEREEATLMYLFGRQIERWTKDEIALRGGRRKSICLPAGTVGFRRQNATLVIDNELRLIAWARKYCPTAIQTTEKLIKTFVNDHFAGSGELPDGCHIEPEKENFRVS